MKIQEVIDYLNHQFLPCYQEEWDNSGLLVGDATQEITGTLVCLDVTPAVVDEAVAKKRNLIVSHHPLIYNGVKRMTATSQLGRMLLLLARRGICVYAAHTDLDNLYWGVSGELCKRLGIEHYELMDPMPGKLRKLVTYCPTAYAEKVREALFQAGAGSIGDYDACSYNLQGNGTFRAGSSCHPFCGEVGEMHNEPETRIEVIYETRIERKLIDKLLSVHPYEEPAYDLLPLANTYAKEGGGAYGLLPAPMETHEFLNKVKQVLHLPIVRCSALCKEKIQRVAVCGGSGAFLIGKAKSLGTDIYLCGDLKYHEFQQAEGDIILADIGHYESEQFAKDIIYRVISEKFCTFATDISLCGEGFIYYI